MKTHLQLRLAAPCADSSAATVNQTATAINGRDGTEIERYLLENPMLERDDDHAADNFSNAQQFDAPQSLKFSESNR